MEVVRKNNWDNIFNIHSFLKNPVIIQTAHLILFSLWN